MSFHLSGGGKGGRKWALAYKRNTPKSSLVYMSVIYLFLLFFELFIVDECDNDSSIFHLLIVVLAFHSFIQHFSRVERTQKKTFDYIWLVTWGQDRWNVALLYSYMGVDSGGRKYYCDHQSKMCT